MPTYQYACTDNTCGHAFEQVQQFSEPALTVCPNCGQRLRKVYGSIGIVFKGSGFYSTDSRAGRKDSLSAHHKAGSSDVSAESGKTGGSVDSATKSSSATESSTSSKTTTSGKSGDSTKKLATASAGA